MSLRFLVLRSLPSKSKSKISRASFLLGSRLTSRHLCLRSKQGSNAQRAPQRTSSRNSATPEWRLPPQTRFSFAHRGSFVNRPPFLITRSFSEAAPASSVPASAAKVASKGSTRSSFFRRFALFVRFVRIPFLVASVYALGYQQGIIDDAANPDATRRALLEQILAGMGVTNVFVVSDDESKEHEKNGARMLFSRVCHRKHQTNPQDVPEDGYRVARIGRQIINVAMLHVKAKLKEAAIRVGKDQRLKDMASAASAVEENELDPLMKLLQMDDEYQFWNMARIRLEGAWKYVLVESPVVNAFVSEVLPKRIFITTSMFKDGLVENDDELALVLGHEISHMILGHVSERNNIDSILRALEVLLLSMDPTEGLLSLAFMGLLASVRQSIEAKHSRDHEWQADELGIKLAAQACFDTRAGAEFMGKMHEHTKEIAEKQSTVSQMSENLVQFTSTHPPTLARYKALKKASETENASKYCSDVKAKLRKVGLGWLQ